MKKLLLITSSLIISFCYGQIDCNITTLRGCNFIQNPSFQSTTTQYGVQNPRAFGQNSVPYWYDSHGTADLNVSLFSPSPIANTNIASMHNIYDGNTTLLAQEGITGKIRRLTTGRRYAFSFFLSTTSLPGRSDADFVSMNVHLITCQNFNNSSGAVPPVPRLSQQIFCRAYPTVGSSNWAQMYVEFTADYEFDMIWFYPEFINAPINTCGNFFGVVYPELIDITNYPIGLDADPNTCLTILTAPCGVTNSEYTWTNSSGAFVGTGAQITVNAATSPGNYTVSMTVPNALLTNNSCSINNPTIRSTVTVDPCVNTPCVAPEITPKGTIDFIVDCDNIATITLQSNIVGSCQWYRDGIAIPGANSSSLNLASGISSGDYTVENVAAVNCISNVVHVNASYVNVGCNPINYFNSPIWYCRGIQSSMTQTPIPGVNPQYSWDFNYPSLASIAPSSNNSAPITFNTIDNSVFVKAITQGQDYTRYFFYNIGITPYLYANPNSTDFYLGNSCQSTGLTIPYGNSIYSSEFYDFGLDATPATLNSSGSGVQQNIVINYSSPGEKTITQTLSNPDGTCRTLTYKATIDGGCKTANPPKKHSILKLIKIEPVMYPNPASALVNIKVAEEPIINLQIYSTNGKLIKSIHVGFGKNMYQLNVQELQNGLYYLKIMTTKNTYTEKLNVLK